MDTIPEELIHQICSFLVPFPPLIDHESTQGLRSLCLVSRKLYRIARSLLYTSVTTNSVTTVRHLLRTLEETPALANHVTYFASQHDGTNCYLVYAQRDPCDQRNCACIIRIRRDISDQRDCECTIPILRTLALLPNLMTLNLMQSPHLKGDSYWILRLDEDESELNVLRHLRKLSLNIGSALAPVVGPLLTLPSLKTLELAMGRRPGDIGWSDDLFTSNVESLSIIGCSSVRQECWDWLSTVFKRLHKLIVAVREVSKVHTVLKHFFQKKENMLQHVHIHDGNPWYYDIEVDTLCKDQLVVSNFQREVMRHVYNHSSKKELEERGYVEMGYQAPGVKSLAMRHLTNEEQIFYQSVLYSKARELSEL